MLARYHNPRHKSPQSVIQTVGRFAGQVVRSVPMPGMLGLIALVGAAGIVVGANALTDDDEATTQPAAVADLAANVDDGAVERLLDDRTQARPDQVSRSAARPALVSVQRETKFAAMPLSRQAVGRAVTETVKPSDPREIAMSLLADYGWGSDQFGCLDQLYVSESGWNLAATNSSSGAYGIPQALPGEKMASAGSDWRTNPATQIEWGLGYIRDSYGSPCGAWSFKQGNNWY